jgi:type VI secretion system protein ImpA
MASPDVLEFAKLLAPISPENPTGVDPRVDPSPNSPYFTIKDDRRKAIEMERPTADGSPDWHVVRELGLKILTEKAKDLGIAVFLTEALARLEGFAGMRDGFRLSREFVEKFWDGLYPLPDKADMEREKALKANPNLSPDEKEELKSISEECRSTRIAPIVGLNGHDAEGTLLAPIARIPLTGMTDIGQFTFAHYNEGKSLKKITDAKLLQQKVDEGKVTLEKFQKAVAESEPAFYVKLVDDINGSLTELTQLGAALDQRCDGRGPPISAIKARITECLDVVKEVAKEKLRVATPAKPETEPAKDGAAPAAPGQPKPQPGVIQTREQALESLMKVADFFRRTEPHSPISYTLDQVVRWGRMPLPELWAELLGEEARKSVFKQVGIRAEEAKAPPKK